MGDKERFTTKEIAEIFGVDEVDEDTRLEIKTIVEHFHWYENERIEFIKKTLAPWIKEWENNK